MAFDEQGQADTFRRKTEICERAYTLLTKPVAEGGAGFPAEDIIFDPNIFAIGDCASCPQPGSDRPVPPRAQAAHQQAMLLAKSLPRRLQGKPLPEYVYRDYGSLVALGRYTTVGNLMGGLARGSMMIEGLIARFVYWSLYKKHQIALHGVFRVVLSTLATFINSPNKPRVKLH
ncbi:MAG: hypothetical protein WHV61_08170, partial [Burkholderiales bacterium]